MTKEKPVRNQEENNAKRPAAPNHKPTCLICKLISERTKIAPFGNERDFQELGVSALYSAMRAEMVDSFTRSTNARNWTMALLLAVLGGFGSYISANGPLHNVTPVSIVIGITVISFFTYQLSMFVKMANKDVVEIASYLLALEYNYELHHWNEHHSWSSRVPIIDSRRRHAWTISQSVIFDFYFWQTLIYLLLVLYISYCTVCDWRSMACALACLFFWCSSAWAAWKNEQLYDERLNQATRIAGWMGSKGTKPLPSTKSNSPICQ